VLLGMAAADLLLPEPDDLPGMIILFLVVGFVGTGLGAFVCEHFSHRSGRKGGR
jgi:hypothetical protein